jgi:hypothetical protein
MENLPQTRVKKRVTGKLIKRPEKAKPRTKNKLTEEDIHSAIREIFHILNSLDHVVEHPEFDRTTPEGLRIFRMLVAAARATHGITTEVEKFEKECGTI